MILELLEHLLTPVSPLARSLGFLESTLQVRARFSRCHADWRPHLEASRASILQAASLCSARRRVVLLGAGLLHDIPLAELSRLFEQVILVDIVHPLPSRWAARRFANVSHLECDLTGIMAQLPEARRHPEAPLPRSAPDWPAADLTISVNVLSQLAWVPSQYLSHQDSVLNPFLEHLLQTHLEHLSHIPGHSALITDVTWTRQNASTLHSESWDVLHGIQLPIPTQQWLWQIAPAPEREPDHHFFAQVAAFPDWKKSAAAAQALGNDGPAPAAGSRDT